MGSVGRDRDMLAGVSCVAFIILGGVTALSAVGLLTRSNAALDELVRAHRVLFAAFVLPPVVGGIALGLVAWVLCLRRHCSLDEMLRPMTRPGTPEWMSRVLGRLVRWAYALRLEMRR